MGDSTSYTHAMRRADALARELADANSVVESIDEADGNERDEHNGPATQVDRCR